ncbi:MAG: SusC/RagA family TonB-linked outer membrane protein [Marinilabiliaceae bacterium]|nr:SusC/RagA family TonB-linked outer membrane protein [Marinilabiliaceae bacterium]
MTLDVRDENIETVLDQLFNDSGVIYRIIDNQIILTTPAKVAEATVQQEAIKINGKVIDPQGDPLPGVNVFEKKNPTHGVITGIDGNYSLEVNSPDEVIVFSFIGFNTQEITVAGRNVINITLVEEATGLDEVVVTALGMKREAKKLGFAMTEVDGEDIAAVNTVNPVSALQGKSAGLSIGASDGGLFGNSKIQVRGVSVLNSDNNQPIFVIDGVIIDNSVSNESADWNDSANDFGNQLKNLNPDDYESVSVLKGAAATALYGSRGINGAIVIKTKDGEGAQGFGVKVTQSIGIDHVYRQPDIQYEFGPGAIAGMTDYGAKDANDKYYRFSTDQFYTNADGIATKKGHTWGGIGFGPRFDGRQLEDYDGSMTTYNGAENNMRDAYELGVNSNTAVALSYGDDRSTFYLSDSYNHRTGVFPTNEFTRNALKLAGSYKITDWLKADASFSFTTSSPKNPRNNLGVMFSTGGFDNWYQTDKWNKREVYQAPHGGTPKQSLGDEYAYVPGNKTWFEYNLNESVRDEQVIRPIVRLTADVTKWMTITAEGNMNSYTIKSEEKNLGTDYLSEGGFYQLRHDTDVSKTGKLVANINKKLTDDISANLIIGGELFEQEKSYTRIKTDGGLIVPGKFFLANSKKTLQPEGKIEGTRQINSLYFLANFGWRDQVYLDITGRNDWSSALVYSDGTGNNSYFYPSVSSSWVFSETFDMPSWMSFGKLRLSWAQVGNDTSPYNINKGYGSETYKLGSGFAYANSVNSTTVDQDILPERKNSFEAGFDIRFLRNRLGFDMAIYDETIKNQIGEVPMDKRSGRKHYLTNVGTLTNKGFELSVNATPVKTADFTWKTTFNYWNNTTTVTDLHKDYGAYKTLGGAVAYGNYRVGSVAYEDGEYGVLMSDSAPLKDENGQKIFRWSENNRAAFYTRSGEAEKIGKINPDFEGSWDNSFSWKNFTASILLDARFGGHIASYSNKYGTAYGRLETSLAGRDEQTGGITWTSQYADTKGRVYHDGIIPEGVFKEGQEVTAPTGDKVNVGGMTYQEAYDKGYVEPTHASYSHYVNNSWGNGVVNDDWFSEVKYIALRNISVGYNLPKTIAQKIKAQNCYVSLNARNLGYLYNSLPNNLNPESFRGTSSNASFRERSFTPYTATYTMTVAIDF